MSNENPKVTIANIAAEAGRLKGVIADTEARVRDLNHFRNLLGFAKALERDLGYVRNALGAVPNGFSLSFENEGESETVVLDYKNPLDHAIMTDIVSVLKKRVQEGL